MKMNVQFLILLAAALSASVTCYGKGLWDHGRTGAERGEGNLGRRSSGSQNYADLQDFVEKYVRDDIRHKLSGFSEKWGFVDVKLSDAKSELEPDFVGHIEKVTCRVTLVPKKGVRHYIPVEWTIDGMDKERARKVGYVLGGLLSENGPITNVLSKTWISAVHDRAHAVKNAVQRSECFNVVKTPIGVPVEDFTGMFIASVYRTKDGEGVYRPVKKSGIQFAMFLYKFDSKNCAVVWEGSGVKCHIREGENPENLKNPFGDSLVTAERLKELGGVPSTNADAVRAVKSAFSTHTANFIEAFSALMAAQGEYEKVVGDSYGSRFVRDRLDELRRQREYPAQMRAERAIATAKRRLGDARHSVQRSEYAVRGAMRERDYISRNLVSAETNYTRAVAIAEQKRAKLAELRKSKPETSYFVRTAVRSVELAEAHEKSCQARVDALRQKLEANEANIVAARKNVETSKAERADAETKLTDTEAEQAAKLKAVSEAIANEVSVAQQAEKARLESVIRAAAEKLDNAWQALALQSCPER